MSILGNRVLRREDPKFLTSGGIYGDDLALDGALWATFVRSTVAHARIAEIDADDAPKAPGVVAVYIGADIDLPPVPAGAPGSPDIMGRPVLATGVVRFAGEAVAVVLTEERYQGEDAAPRPPGRGRRRRHHPQPAPGRRPTSRRPGPGCSPGPPRGGPLRHRRQPGDVEPGRLRIISSTELPSFELVAMATPTPINQLGAKGIGESALSHLGVRHLDMPATPERVWRAITENSPTRGNA